MRCKFGRIFADIGINSSLEYVHHAFTLHRLSAIITMSVHIGFAIMRLSLFPKIHAASRSTYIAGAQLGCLSLLSCLVLASPAMAQKNLLQGGVNHTDRQDSGGPGTTLNRNDVRSTDSFAPPTQSAEPVFAPPSFAVPTMTAPLPPSNPFPLNAQSDETPDFQGQQGIPTFGQQPSQSMPHSLGAQQDQQPAASPADPDSTPEMRLLWDAWHRRVAEAVFVRYSSLANAAFANSPPIGAIAAYSVSRDGRISNVRLNQKSGNPMYNAIVLMAIQSLNGNLAILQFPPNSRRMNMEKLGNFTQNYGQNIGFKTIIGDQETVPGRR
jgi:hypothetical protein